MSAESVTAALAGWENRLRSLGAAAVDCLRPGLTREEVDGLSAEFEGGLPEEAAAIWMWHDGSDHGDAPMPGMRGLVPYRFFLPLREAFASARTLYEGSSAPIGRLEKLSDGLDNGAVTWIYPQDSPEPPGQASWYRPWWLVILTGGSTTFVDCADPSKPETFVGVWDPHDDLYVGQLTVGERVWWWHWALDTGYWWIDDNGLWATDNDKRPEAVFGDIAYRHVLP